MPCSDGSREDTLANHKAWLNKSLLKSAIVLFKVDPAPPVDMHIPESVTAWLCYILRTAKAADPEYFEAVIYNAKSRISRDLANWWEDHVENDLANFSKHIEESEAIVALHKRLTDVAPVPSLLMVAYGKRTDLWDILGGNRFQTMSHYKLRWDRPETNLIIRLDIPAMVPDSMQEVEAHYAPLLVAADVVFRYDSDVMKIAVKLPEPRVVELTGPDLSKQTVEFLLEYVRMYVTG